MEARWLVISFFWFQNVWKESQKRVSKSFERQNGRRLYFVTSPVSFQLIITIWVKCVLWYAVVQARLLTIAKHNMTLWHDRIQFNVLSSLEVRWLVEEEGRLETAKCPALSKYLCLVSPVGRLCNFSELNKCESARFAWWWQLSQTIDDGDQVNRWTNDWSLEDFRRFKMVFSKFIALSVDLNASRHQNKAHYRCPSYASAEFL